MENCKAVSDACHSVSQSSIAGSLLDVYKFLHDSIVRTHVQRIGEKSFLEKEPEGYGEREEGDVNLGERIRKLAEPPEAALQLDIIPCSPIVHPDIDVGSNRQSKVYGLEMLFRIFVMNSFRG